MQPTYFSSELGENKSDSLQKIQIWASSSHWTVLACKISTLGVCSFWAIARRKFKIALSVNQPPTISSFEALRTWAVTLRNKHTRCVHRTHLHGCLIAMIQYAYTSHCLCCLGETRIISNSNITSHDYASTPIICWFKTNTDKRRFVPSRMQDIQKQLCCCR